MKLVKLTPDTELRGFDCCDNAYLSAIDFYQKNNFKILSEKILSDHTRLMFFDMMELE